MTEATELRQKKLRGLRINAAQSTSWQTSVVDIFDEMDARIRRLEIVVTAQKKELAEMRGERLALTV